MSAKSNVTVIIPCYNDGLYIMQALNSVLNQTVKADKIIIVDDGSNQETKKVLEKIKNDEVTIIYQENQGVCKARNNAIQLAETDYILNLDADDYFEPTFIEKAIDILNHNQEIAVVGCLVKTLTNNRIDTEIKKPLGGVVKDFIVKNNGIASSLFRKQCWEQVSGYDENMKNGYEDWEFWIAILKHNWKMHIIQEPLFVYRIKPQSRDQKAAAQHDFNLKKYIFLKHKELFEEHFEFYALELLRQNSIFRTNKNKHKNSIDFKIGNAIFEPIRFLKKIIKK
ncbi:glycosyltransferase family 2 protein [Flavobacterium endoglycinae]|uniref:Glycosyltransferase family 2 protein n=1 Tax=Flavobacterium endoglycinae TaxID=2816357 RepID=A0ABX7Q8Y5_9FLAO|nr:glycosyltransferase family A protein [Flavobacterium endoglycinae]QSW87485.1 glycosyltransferase family 2 protein [Flavobacterium endoglycinae]